LLKIEANKDPVGTILWLICTACLSLILALKTTQFLPFGVGFGDWCSCLRHQGQ